MRKFLAPCWPRVTAESRVAEGRAHLVNVLNMRENSSNCSTDQISLLNGEFCLLTGSNASFQQWLQSGSSVSSQRLYLFPEHTRSPHWRHILSVMALTDIIYLNFIFSSSLIMRWASGLISLWPEAMSKPPEAFLWLCCMNRGPVGDWDGMGHRSGLLRLHGKGHSEWVLAHLGKGRIGHWLPLSTVGATLSEVSYRAAFLVSYWFVVLSHLSAVKWKHISFNMLGLKWEAQHAANTNHMCSGHIPSFSSFVWVCSWCTVSHSRSGSSSPTTIMRRRNRGWDTLCLPHVALSSIRTRTWGLATSIRLWGN